MITIPFIGEGCPDRILDSLKPFDINTNNWPGEFSYEPSVKVAAYHDGKFLHLKWHVIEDCAKAEVGESGNPVYMDSCVECFISPEAGDGLYYNFEWNCIGCLDLACRSGRFDPIPAPKEVLDSVKAVSSLGTKTFKETGGGVEWTLRVDIPASALFHHSVESWSGKKFKINMYKCGDGLSKLHYLTWAPVLTEHPDYHRPEYFREVSFE